MSTPAPQPSESVAVPSDRSLRLANLAARVADENRAKDIRILDLRKITSVFDFFVIATGTSVRQLHAIADDVEKAAEEELGDKKLGVEGYTQGGWVLLDFGDVVVHLFDADARDYYALEDLWGSAPRTDYPAASEKLGVVGE